MKKPLRIETDAAENVVVLSISPTEEDHTALKRILSCPESTASTESRWAIYPALALESALPVLRENPIAIVLSERDLVPGTWKDVLAETLNLSDPPLLIVASRLTDEYLWAEALNLGAYDVLAKPSPSGHQRSRAIPYTPTCLLLKYELQLKHKLQRELRRSGTAD